MIRSMTAFATEQGHADGASWVWDVRSVNGRGLDVKVRLPDGIDGLEVYVRNAITAVAARGNVTVNLRLQRDQSDGPLEIDPMRLDTILESLDAVQERAFEKGVTLGQPTAADVLATRGVLVAGAASTSEDLKAPLIADFDTALAAFVSMRNQEGAVLHSVITAQIDEIETLTEKAATAAQTRTTARKAQMADALARVMETAASADPDRVAQELALIAVKSDITEEIDRLGAHIVAARDLLKCNDETLNPVGRKLDFLTQEFNREANTLCSKALDVDLTQIGLALKAVIDQMREQVQNVE